MSPAWPETIGCGQAGASPESARKTDLSKAKSRSRFWPGTQTDENGLFADLSTAI
jgi:hypothetical protein